MLGPVATTTRLFPVRLGGIVPVYLKVEVAIVGVVLIEGDHEAVTVYVPVVHRVVPPAFVEVLKEPLADTVASVLNT
jgi:hypothetical protein